MNRTKTKRAAAKRTREREHMSKIDAGAPGTALEQLGNIDQEAAMKAMGTTMSSTKKKKGKKLPVIKSVTFGVPEHTAKLSDGSMIVIRGNLVGVNNDRIEVNGIMYADGRSKENKDAFDKANLEWADAENKRRAEVAKTFTDPNEFAANAKERDKAKAKRFQETKVKPARKKVKTEAKEESSEPKVSRRREANGNGRDQFGHRIGSQASEINKTLSLTPKTVKQMCEECKLGDPRVKSHMHHLLSRKLIVKHDNGTYSLPGGEPAQKPSKAKPAAEKLSSKQLRAKRK